MNNIYNIIHLMNNQSNFIEDTEKISWFKNQVGDISNTEFYKNKLASTSDIYNFILDPDFKEYFDLMFVDFVNKEEIYKDLIHFVPFNTIIKSSESVPIKLKGHKTSYTENEKEYNKSDTLFKIKSEFNTEEARLKECEKGITTRFYTQQNISNTNNNVDITSDSYIVSFDIGYTAEQIYTKDVGEGFLTDITYKKFNFNSDYKGTLIYKGEVYDIKYNYYGKSDELIISANNKKKIYTSESKDDNVRYKTYLDAYYYVLSEHYGINAENDYKSGLFGLAGLIDIICKYLTDIKNDENNIYTKINDSNKKEKELNPLKKNYGTLFDKFINEEDLLVVSRSEIKNKISSLIYKFNLIVSKQDELIKKQLEYQTFFNKFNSNFFNNTVKKIFTQKENFNNEFEINLENPNKPDIFNNIKIISNTNTDLSKQLINEIDEICIKLDNDNTSNVLKLGCDLINKSLEFIINITTSINYPINQFIINKIAKLPLVLYNKIKNNSSEIEKIQDEFVIKIFNNFGFWIKVVCNSPLAQIYKYAYLLLLNLIIGNINLNNYTYDEENKDNKENYKYFVDTKAIIEEFIIDINSVPLNSISLIKDINIIKDGLSDLKLWYWNNESLINIFVLQRNLIKSITPDKILTTADLDICHILDINDNYFKGVEVPDTNMFRGDRVDISDNKSSFYGDKMNKSFDNYAPPLKIHDTAFLLKFINFNTLGQVKSKKTTEIKLNDLDKVSMLLQIVNNCKMKNLEKSKFPFQIPYVEDNFEFYLDNYKDEKKVNDTGKDLLEDITDYSNNFIYKAKFNVIIKTTSTNKRHIVNEFNTTNITTSNDEYINSYINYLYNYNSSYLTERIIPFINYGYQLLDNKDDVYFKPIQNNNIEDLNLINKFETYKNNYDILTNSNLNKNINKFNFENLENFYNLNNTAANIYLFVYFYLNDNETILKLLTGNKKLSKKIEIVVQIDKDNEKNYSKEIILIILSNYIKFHTLISKINIYDNILEIINLIESKEIQIQTQYSDKKSLQKVDKLISIFYDDFSIPFILIRKYLLNSLKKKIYNYENDHTTKVTRNINGKDITRDVKVKGKGEGSYFKDKTFNDLIDDLNYNMEFKKKGEDIKGLNGNNYWAYSSYKFIDRSDKDYEILKTLEPKTYFNGGLDSREFDSEDIFNNVMTTLYGNEYKTKRIGDILVRVANSGNIYPKALFEAIYPESNKAIITLNDEAFSFFKYFNGFDTMDDLEKKTDKWEFRPSPKTSINLQKYNELPFRTINNKNSPMRLYIEKLIEKINKKPYSGDMLEQYTKYDDPIILNNKEEFKTIQINKKVKRDEILLNIDLDKDEEYFESESEPETEENIESEPKLEPKPKPETEENIESEPKLEPKPKAETEENIESEPKLEPKPKPKPEPESKNTNPYKNLGCIKPGLYKGVFRRKKILPRTEYEVFPFIVYEVNYSLANYSSNNENNIQLKINNKLINTGDQYKGGKTQKTSKMTDDIKYEILQNILITKKPVNLSNFNGIDQIYIPRLINLEYNIGYYENDNLALDIYKKSFKYISKYYNFEEKLKEPIEIKKDKNFKFFNKEKKIIELELFPGEFITFKYKKPNELDNKITLIPIKTPDSELEFKDYLLNSTYIDVYNLLYKIIIDENENKNKNNLVGGNVPIVNAKKFFTTLCIKVIDDEQKERQNNIIKETDANVQENSEYENEDNLLVGGVAEYKPLEGEYPNGNPRPDATRYNFYNRLLPVKITNKTNQLTEDNYKKFNINEMIISNLFSFLSDFSINFVRDKNNIDEDEDEDEETTAVYINKFNDMVKEITIQTDKTENKKFTVFKSKSLIDDYCKYYMSANNAYLIGSIINKNFTIIPTNYDKLWVTFIIKENIINFIEPVYLDNPIFYDTYDKNYFKFDSSSNQIIPTEKNRIYKNMILNLNPNSGDITRVNKGITEKYVYIYNIEYNEFLDFLIQNTSSNELFSPNTTPYAPYYILCWVNITNNKITTIDVLDLQIRFDFMDDGRVIFNNQNQMVINYQNVDYNILKWVNKNTFLSLDLSGNYYLNVFKNNYLKNDYLKETKTSSSFVSVKINKNTYLPVVEDFNTLSYLLSVYINQELLFNEFMPLIHKYNEKDIYESGDYDKSIADTNKKFNIILSIIEKNINIYKTMTKATNKKEKPFRVADDYQVNRNPINFDELRKTKYFELFEYIKLYKNTMGKEDSSKHNYEIDYKYIPKNIINDNKLDDLYYAEYYIFTSDYSFSEYMLLSLINNNKKYFINYDNNKKEIFLRDIAFSMFYSKIKPATNLELDTKLCPEIDEEPSKFSESIEPNFEEIFSYNPFEFYFQYIFGIFARDIQKDLAKNIFEDLTQKQIQLKGGYNYRVSKFYSIINEKYQNVSKQPKIYNLIMGGGKTSMITPLVIIKYLLYLTTLPKEKQKQNCYIVLPEKLVKQSAQVLGSILNMYFPINVRVCEEKRNNNDVNISYTQTLDISKDDIGSYLNVYVLSDTSLKCGFINSYEEVLYNSKENNHIYLFDEADSILNPITSALNYPKENTVVNMIGLNEYFGILYDIFLLLYKKPELNSELNDLLIKNKAYYIESPHFLTFKENIVFIKSLQSWVINYLHERLVKNLKTKLIAEYIKLLNNSNAKEEDFINQIDKISENPDKLNILNILYSLINFIKTVFPYVITLKNRVNFGLGELSFSNKLNKTVKAYLAIPYIYNETPATGSKFSNPMVTLSLTMIDYIIQIKPLNEYPYVVDDFITLIQNEYNNESELNTNINDIFIYKKYKEIYKENEDIYNILEVKSENLNQNQQKNLVNIQYLTKKYCEEECNKMTIEKERDNINGIDLFMSFNIASRVGFTGTANISPIIDLNESKQIKVELDKKTINDTTYALENKCEIIRVENFNSNAKLIEHILETNPKINVIIDVGGEFVKLTPLDIYNIVLTVFKNKTRDTTFQYIYWDDTDTKMSIDYYGNEKEWNGDISKNMYYYYDHKHTTGTDAVIPSGSVGAAFLNNNSRYRDVVQSIFRMRCLNKKDRDTHLIKFIVSDRLKNLIITKLNNSSNVNKKIIKKEITKIELLSWFDILENESKEDQNKLSCVQNIKALSRNSREKGIKFLKSNNFRFFDESNSSKFSSKDFYDFISEIESFEKISVNKYLNIIVENNNKLTIKNKGIDYLDKLYKTINNKEIIDLTSGNTDLNIEQDQDQAQAQAQAIQRQRQRNINKNADTNANIIDKHMDMPPFKNKIYYDFTLKEYFIYNPQYYMEIITDYLYQSINFSNYDYFDYYPAQVIYFNYKLYTIPNIEGFKLADFLIQNTNSIDRKFIIFDTSGTLYYAHNYDGEDDKIYERQSYVKIIFTPYVRRIKRINISIQDIYNFILFITEMIEKNKDIKLIIEHIKNISSSSNIFQKYMKEAISLLELNKEERLERINNVESNFYLQFTNNGKYTDKYIEFTKKYKKLTKN